MTVRTALGLINKALDEILTEQLQTAVMLEPEIPVESAGMVFLDHEAVALGLLRDDQMVVSAGGALRLRVVLSQATLGS